MSPTTMDVSAASDAAMEVCGPSASEADCALVASLCGILERAGGPGGLAVPSARCRAALDGALGALEEAGGDDACAAADALDAIDAIWHLCEVGFFDGGRARGARLAAWLRRHCVDGETEDAEYAALVPLLRRLREPPEAWAPPDGPAPASEAESPFWQVVYRLCLRGRCADAWDVLETHSTCRDRALSQLWAPVKRLLTGFPAAPDAEDAADPDRDGALGAYAARLATWRGDASRARRDAP